MTTKSTATKLLPKHKLRVRMYRVGFGDCFLLSVPNAGGHAHILIDCGVHFNGDIHSMGDVIDDIAKVTDKKLALVIATHAHQDHISGFGAFPEKFRAFDVGEVWLPWLENTKDKDAKKLRAKRLALATTLRAHFTAAPPSAADAAVIEDILVNATGITKTGVSAAGTNAAAMDLLTSGFRGQAKVRYLAAGEEFADVAGIKGFRARILAPSRDTSFLDKMDPPLSQRYKLKLGDGSVEERGGIKPFDADWVFTDFPDGKPPLDSKGRLLLQKAIASPMDAFALALDKVLNNTSLVVLFRCGDEALLFPGDAQWGNWLSWLDENGDDVLSGVTFYKVAHHGSVNATPKRALEAMQKGRFAAMASTQSKPWPSIPAPKLITAIEDRTDGRFVQSDSLPVADAPEGPKLGKLPAAFTKGALWFDYIA
ncbi:MAG: MBL fold metallo-hydrolase [Acidobacteria bacterium]|nr:MBL fold metallo-hydrolase [Acidobacteriota bacterium]MBV9478858.1 MBL fold metallo-hydrolase [Acidobacteriota bacterium]